MSDLTSRPYRPDAAYCCEACIFGRGKHSAKCEATALAAFAADVERNGLTREKATEMERKYPGIFFRDLLKGYGRAD